MSKNIFSPYKILLQIPQKIIELELPKTRRNINFFLFRIYPFLLLALLLIVIFFTEKGLPLIYLVLLSAVIILLFFLMLFKKYTTHILIDNKKISITEKAFLATNHHSFLIADVKKIACFETFGRGGGTYFSVVLNNNKKIGLLAIPMPLMSKGKTNAIIKIIEEITGLTIQHV